MLASPENSRRAADATGIDGEWMQGGARYSLLLSRRALP